LLLRACFKRCRKAAVNPLAGHRAALRLRGRQSGAVHDLKILSARMEKDRAGTTAVWLVDVSNK